MLYEQPQRPYYRRTARRYGSHNRSRTQITMETLPAQHQALQLDYDCTCSSAGKETNEDAAGVVIPDSAYVQNYKGAAFVVADGVSSAEAGQQASQTALHSSLTDY